MMERRNFLKGVLVGTVATAGEAIVRLASPEDVRMLAPKSPVVLGHELNATYENTWGWAGREVWLKLDRGFEPVGFVKRVEFSRQVRDVVDVSGVVTLVPGLKEGVLVFEGMVRDAQGGGGKRR